jgi:hypothetical protein
MAQADGTVLMEEPCKYVGPFKRQIILIGATTGADNGVWIDASDLLYFTIEFAGTATGVAAQLYGSNAQAQPTTFNATDSKIGSAITTLGFTSFTGPYRWINLRVSSVTGGNVQAVLQALTQ